MEDPKVVLFTLCLIWTSVGAQDVPQLIANASDVSLKHVIYNKPIVIHTQLDNYEQPTLREYQECHENAEKCRLVCKGVSNAEACEKQCPICPELIREEQVVQGVNDTLVAPQAAPINTTNVIRLTNQIHNIIDNSRGNITYRNENVLHLHQNVSRVGGKFGLGHTGSDPCCIILRSKRQCDEHKFSTAARCHRKRHRVCGPQCKARIMLAKIVTECEQPDPFDYFVEQTERNCHQTVKYIPYRQRRAVHGSNKCSYIPNWPFVACPQALGQIPRGRSCDGCMRLPYAFLLRNGIPLQCLPCFRSLGAPNYGYGSYPPPLWYPTFGPSMFDPPIVDGDFDIDTTDDWSPDRVKCISPEGTVTDDCLQVEGSGSASAATEGAAIVGEFEDDYDYAGEDPFIRRRRQTFARSKYSRRHRQ